MKKEIKELLEDMTLGELKNNVEDMISTIYGKTRKTLEEVKNEKVGDHLERILKGEKK